MIMFATRICCYFVCIAQVFAQNWRENTPIVRTQQGSVQGLSVQTDSRKTVTAFLGVPYAAPPVAQLRFAPPREHPQWNGTRPADQFRPNCPQLPQKPGLNDQEDCLHLNIWTPSQNYAPLPVVVFFEGRDFYQSSEHNISGEDFASENLIFISVNYRLNVFGFFCLGSNDARGNLGILDQYFALVWIKNNIKQFGGDSEKITLYGHLSGAVAVALHMTSPRTAGLFQRAILSSGSALAPWQLANDPIAASRQLLRILGCDGYTINPLNCIRLKKIEEILNALNEYSENYSFPDRFLPVTDLFLPENNRYLPMNPLNAFREGTYLQVPVLTGISKPIANEQFMQWMELASQGYPQLMQYTEKAKIPEIMRLYLRTTSGKERIFDLIKWKYFSGVEDDVRVLFDQLKHLEYEAKVEAPHFLQLSYLITSYVQPIYVYFMDDIGFSLNTNDGTITSDLLLLLGPKLLREIGRRRFNSNEYQLSRHIKQLWTNFIVFGNPTPNNQVDIWRKYTSVDNYIENLASISNHSIALTERKEINRRVLFWNQLLSKISAAKGNLPNTIPKELQNSPDPASTFRHAMYTLVALVIALLVLLLICIILLKKRSKERETHLHMGY